MAYSKSDFVKSKMANNKQQLINSAIHLIEQGGWKNCTTTNVAKHSGFAIGTIYTYFKDVTALHFSTYKAIADKELALLEKITSGDASPRERLIEAVDLFTARALEGKSKAYAQISEPTNPKMQKLKQRYMTLFVKQFELIIDEGIKSGFISEQDSRVSATCLFSALNGALKLKLDPDSQNLKLSDEEFKAQIINLCLNMVVGTKG